MPIYEFLCTPCNTIFNFFTSKIDTRSTAACPRCSDELKRKPATFATLKQLDAPAPDPFSRLDGDALDGAMRALTEEYGAGGEEESPRQMARLLRRFGEESGMEMGAGMQEMIARLEAGADPESLDEEFGAQIDDAEALKGLFRVREALAEEVRRPPTTDQELYFL